MRDGGGEAREEFLGVRVVVTATFNPRPTQLISPTSSVNENDFIGFFPAAGTKALQRGHLGSADEVNT